MRNIHRIVALFCLLAFISPLAAEPTIKIEPYSQTEFPSWARDLRRTEIITLGSLPFTTLGARIGYTFYRYFKSGFDSEYVPNPMSKTSEGAKLDTDEQKLILKIAVAGSLVIGVTDLAVSIWNRSKDSKEQKKELERFEEAVTITPVNQQEEMQE